MKTKLLILTCIFATLTAWGQLTVTDRQVIQGPVKTNTVTMIVQPVKYDLFYAYKSGPSRNGQIIWRHVSGTNLTDVVNNLGNATVAVHQ